MGERTSENYSRSVNELVEKRKRKGEGGLVRGRKRGGYKSGGGSLREGVGGSGREGGEGGEGGREGGREKGGGGGGESEGVSKLKPLGDL